MKRVYLVEIIELSIVGCACEKSLYSLSSICKKPPKKFKTMAPVEVGPCRVMYAVAALTRLYCGPGATVFDVERYQDVNYKVIEWHDRRCFAELLRALPRSCHTVLAPHCCWPAELVDGLKLKAPKCEPDGHRHDDGRRRPADESTRRRRFNEGAATGYQWADQGRSQPTPRYDAADRHHEHTLWAKVLEEATDLAIMLVVLVLLVCHRKIVNCLLGCVGRSPSPPRRPRARFSPVPYDDESTVPYYSTVPEHPASSAERAAIHRMQRPPGHQSPPPPPVPPKEKEEETSVKTVAEGASSQSSSPSTVPWVRRPPQKVRKVHGKNVDLGAYTDAVVWAASKLTVPETKELLGERAVEFDDGPMDVRRRCELLALAEEKSGLVDWVAAVRRVKLAAAARAAEASDGSPDEQEDE